MAGFVNDIMVAENVDFRNVKPAVGQMTTDGDLLIGSTAAPNIKKGVLTSPDASIVIGYDDPNITIVTSGGVSGLQTLTGDSGGAISPSVGNINLIGQDGITTSGSGSTITITPRGAGTNNMFLGLVSGNTTLTGVSNLGYGAVSLQLIDTGTGNVAIGTQVLSILTDGDLNVGIGTASLALNQTGNNNTCVGAGSGRSLDSNGNTAVGFESLTNLIAGTNNIAIGNLCMSLTTGANENVAIGNNALQSTTSNGNVAIGSEALISNITGFKNVCIGKQAGYSSSNSVNNVAIGTAALFSNVGGAKNVIMGTDAGATLNSSDNTLIGNGSGFALSAGSRNTALGSNTFVGGNGSNNIVIGIDSAFSYTGTESGNILLDNLGVLGESNIIRIGTSQTQCYVQGISGVTVSNPAPVFLNTSTGQLGTGSAALIAAWTDVTGASQTVAVNNGYLSDNAGTVAFALPATASQFSIFRIVGVQGAWTLSQAANQQIKIGNTATTVGVTGSLASSNAGDCIECIAVVGGASTIWRVMSMVGNITVA